MLLSVIEMLDWNGRHGIIAPRGITTKMMQQYNIHTDYGGDSYKNLRCVNYAANNEDC